VRPAPAGGADDPLLSVAALWRESVAVAQRNADLLAIVASALFFLPQLAGVELGPLVGATDSEPSVPLLVLSMLAGLVGQGAVTLIALDDLGGGRRTLAQALAEAVRRLPQLLGASLAAGIAIGLGLLALILPGLWLLGRLGAVGAGVMAERQGLAASLERSWELTRERAWPPAVYLLLLLVLVLAALFTGGLVAAALGAVATLTVGQAMGDFLTNVVMAAATAAAVTFIYVAQAVLYRQLLATWRPGAS